jgi:cation diffusion facilitator family transporter
MVLVLTAAFVSLELTGAVLARSQVLLADGLHLLLDVFALGLSITAMRLAIRPPSDRFTFGLRRIEPLAAVGNGALVLLVACAIVRESLVDLAEPSSPRPTIMLIVATAALVVHGVSAWMIHDAMHAVGPALAAHDHADDHSPDDAHDTGHDHEHGHAHPRGRGHALNLRGVWLHLVGDMLGALTALIAAVVIRAGGSARVDAVGSLLVALILFVGAVRLLRDAGLVLLDAAPSHLPTRAVRDLVLSERGVTEVEELRVWSVGAGHDAATVRVKVGRDAEPEVARRIRGRLRDQLGIELVTVEVTEG